jgi:uncharacterized membrane protein
MFWRELLWDELRPPNSRRRAHLRNRHAASAPCHYSVAAILNVADRREGDELDEAQGGFSFAEAIIWAGRVMEAGGVAIIVLGAALATVRFLAGGHAAGPPDRADGDGRYRAYRQGLGQAILLGLEFLVAGDIIRTVAVDPTFASVGVLAIIVLIRTFLSMTLQLEVDGRWPWQSGDRGQGTGGRNGVAAETGLAVAAESETGAPATAAPVPKRS